MKNKILLLVSSFILHHQVFAQGALTPPGAPAPTMKTLAQIEPRTPIATNTTPGDANNLFIISQPGSYYLTANIVSTTTYAGNGIEILANNVTLDLDGFGVACTSTNLNTYGISIPNSQTNIVVRNGNVSGWASGVNSSSVSSPGLVIEKLNVANCYKGYAPFSAGISTLGPAVIRDCAVVNNGNGITCNGNVALHSSLITDCTADNNVVGITLSGSGTISGCTANNNSSVGIEISFNQFGPSASDGCLVTQCIVNNNLSGIYIAGARNRVENNHAVANSAYGINVDVGSGGFTNNIIIKNSVEKSGVANYVFTGTQITGPIITTTGTITNSNPWANFSF